MKLKQLLETVLLAERITLKVLDYMGSGEKIIFEQLAHDKIPYTKILEFLDYDVVTVATAVDQDNQPYLYIELN